MADLSPNLLKKPKGLAPELENGPYGLMAQLSILAVQIRFGPPLF